MKRTALLSGLLMLSLILSVGLAPAQNFRNTQDVLRFKAGPMAKVGADLAQLQQEHAAALRQGRGATFTPSNSLMRVSLGLVTIDAVADGDAQTLRADLEALGLQNTKVFGRVVSGRLPIGAIDDMAALASLQFARPSYMTTHIGSVDSQGDAAMRSDVARTTFGVDGTGVTVGTLSDSFNCLDGAAGDVASGDLPAGIVVLEDFNDPSCTDEGRAMMQLIADVAPGATQAFHTAQGGQANFALGIQELAGCPPGSQMGCTPDPNITANVIVDDIIYFVEPMFQDGIIAQAIDVVKNAGVAYFSSAGNSGRNSYQSSFTPTEIPIFADVFAHDFDPGPDVNTCQSIIVPTGNTVISFQWQEPFFSVSGMPGSASDLDIFVFAEPTCDNLLFFGADMNIGADPVEVIRFTNSGPPITRGLAIGKFNPAFPSPDPTPSPGLMKYVVSSPTGFSIVDFPTFSNTIYGHANAAGAEAVGAAFYDNTPEFGTDPPLLEPFSSAGPTPILFETDGTPKPTPEVRDKPEIVAPDRTNTTFFGSDVSEDSDTFPNFPGTSAAAPHAAGVAALLKELDSSLTPDEIYSALETTAIDMNGSGFDFDTGFGLIQADAALDTGPSERVYTLSVVSSGDGAGSITSAPPGIDCGVDCSETYVSMTPVTLTATPQEGSAFTGWSEASCPGTAPCVVTITEDRTITATFKRLFSLSVTKAGTGDGTITSDLPGIDCGNDCSETYVSGSTITLTTTPASDSRFIGWSGDCSGGDACVVTMTEDRAVTAVFEGNPPPVANAGVDQTVDEGILVLLDGSQSTLLNGTLSYSWMQTGGDPVTLSNTNAAQSTFTSPNVDANGAVLVFELTVTDSRGLSSTDSVQITVLDTNIPPMADAGPDQLVEENTQVMLDGANSSDSDGKIESFVWLQMAGPPVSLSDPTSPQPVFTAPIVALAAGFLPGDTLPGFVLQQRAAGSIADVAARGTYGNGQWTVMFTRALTTLDPDADVQFDLSDAVNLYAFSIAYLDNTGAAPPRSAAAAVMATQDTAPYTLGNATSGADLQARRETPPDCSAFTGMPLVTTPADLAVVPSLTLQAAYDDINLYLCVRAPDPNGMADERPEQWEFLGPKSTDWERKPNAVNVMGGTPTAFDEDRIALWWNINAQDFATEGCLALCHNQRMQSRNPAGRADLWHWKAGTTNLAGLAQDQGLSADPALCPEHPCRQSDGAAEAIAQPNVRRVETLMLPAFIAADGPGASVRALFADEVPLDCPDCALAQSAAVFDDMLEFELTVTDDGGLSASDRVTVQVMETGTSDTDADGVSNAVEDQAPNNGDGNNDGVVDRRQPHVASLPNWVNGTYVTIESPSDSVLADVRAIPNPSPGNAPSNTEFPIGFFTFVIQGLTPADAATMTLYLPAGTAPNTYYKFGPTPDAPSFHWYEFLFNTATGAELAGDRVVLHLQDGERGDDDLTANGAIMDPGAVAIATTPTPTPTPSGGGGGGGGCTMMPGARVDPTLLATLFLILAYLGWHRTRRVEASCVVGSHLPQDERPVGHGSIRACGDKGTARTVRCFTRRARIAAVELAPPLTRNHLLAVLADTDRRLDAY